MNLTCERMVAPGVLFTALWANSVDCESDLCFDDDYSLKEVTVLASSSERMNGSDNFEGAPELDAGPEINSMFSALEQPEVREEDYAPPTEDCLAYARQLLHRLLVTYGILPYKLVITRDGAIYAAYRNESADSLLRLEIDNDLDAIATVSVGRQVTVSGDFAVAEEERAVIGGFDKRLEEAASA